MAGLRITVDCTPELERLVDGLRDGLKHKVWYLCDGRACENGCNTQSLGYCQHTSDIRHAVNFQLDRDGAFRERE